MAPTAWECTPFHGHLFAGTALAMRGVFHGETLPPRSCSAPWSSDSPPDARPALPLPVTTGPAPWAFTTTIPPSTRREVLPEAGPRPRDPDAAEVSKRLDYHHPGHRRPQFSYAEGQPASYLGLDQRLTGFRLPDDAGRERSRRSSRPQTSSSPPRGTGAITGRASPIRNRGAAVAAGAFSTIPPRPRRPSPSAIAG
jgi:hypothetical protein